MEYVTTRIWAAALSVLLFVISTGAWALGLGNIEVNSTLNEPLRARINLSALQVGDLDGMQVRLASAEQFKRAGIQRPFQLSKLRFKAVEGSDGGGHITVTTRDPVVEPFLNFLVEVAWPRGRIVREYTILLDPPVYGAAISTREKKNLAEIQARALQEQPAPAPAGRVRTPLLCARHRGPVHAGFARRALRPSAARQCADRLALRTGQTESRLQCSSPDNTTCVGLSEPLPRAIY